MDKTRLDEILRAQLERTLMGTDLPDLGKRYLGETRDHYVDGNSRALVVTDRLVAFDNLVVCTVPFLGQIRNQLAQYWLEESASVAPNHLISVPDPNCMIVHECRPLPVAFEVYGYLTGAGANAPWPAYSGGERTICGYVLPDFLAENQELPEPLLVTTIAGDQGERALARDQLVADGTVSVEHFDSAAEMARNLFAFGQQRAARQGLVLVQSRYQFGLTSFGQIMVISDLHGFDGARFWHAEDMHERVDSGLAPRELERDYARRWLREESGFDGQGEPPDVPDDVRVEAARRLIESYERITGRTFEPDADEQPNVRVARNLGCI